MDLRKGIIVGTINRLQLNKWLTKRFVKRRFWQLIAIFEQSKLVSLYRMWIVAEKLKYAEQPAKGGL